MQPQAMNKVANWLDGDHACHEVMIVRTLHGINQWLHEHCVTPLTQAPTAAVLSHGLGMCSHSYTRFRCRGLREACLAALPWLPSCGSCACGVACRMLRDSSGQRAGQFRSTGVAASASGVAVF